jgi:hypothetical protein
VKSIGRLLSRSLRKLDAARIRALRKSTRWRTNTGSKLSIFPPIPDLFEIVSEARPFFSTLHDLLDRNEALTLGELAEAAGEQTYGFLILILALPSVVPGLNVGAAPVGGAVLMTIGWQMARGVRKPWIPERTQRQVLHKGWMKNSLARIESYLDRLGSRNKIRRALNQRWMGVLVVWSGLLLALPVPLPFGNLLPASVLILQGAALLEERPSWGWCAALGAAATTIYFAMSYDIIIRTCLKALEASRHWFH